MVKYYDVPILLIEFDSNRSFSLVSMSELSMFDISPTSMVSKMCLLTIHFPRLRIIWSRHLHATASIFQAIKSNCEEPDVETCANIGLEDMHYNNNNNGGSGGGVNSSIGANKTGEDRKQVILNESAVDLVRRLPGVTSANIWNVLKRCDCVKDLCELTSEEVIAMLGSTKNGKQLYDFLHAKTPQLVTV